jgi:hypothetical protein
MIKSRRMRWARHVSRMWEGRSAYRALRGNLKEIDHVECPGVDDSIVLRWIFRNWNGEAWTGLIWFRVRTGVGLL